MPDLGSNTELWEDAESDSLWERNPISKTFSLVSFRGKKVDRRWGVHDYAKAMNCGLSNSPADGASDLSAVTFPPGFKYSPNNGKALVKTGPKVCTWLPVSGSESLKSGLLRGGCLTTHPLKLRGNSFLNRDPDFELPLPGHGRYRFCAGAFGLSSTFLLALDAVQGVIYCWLASLGEWAELMPSSDAPYLGTDTLPPDAWDVEARDLTGDSILFWSSDSGLVAVKIDVLSLTYEAKLLVEGRCLSVPRIIRDQIYVLIEKPDGMIRVVSVDSGWISEERPCDLDISDIPEAKWVVAAATPREVIWLSVAGQVVLRPHAQQYLYIPWEAGVEPQFRLGGPHCSADGHLWMQVLHPTVHEGERGFCYIQLGRKNPEHRPSFGARTLTGGSSIKVEKWLKGDPWIEPTVVANKDHENDEAVIPILESINDRTMLVLRVDHLMGITRLFERNNEIFSVRFQIMGQHGDGGFYVRQLREPWNATAYIFEGALCIYHPDIGSIPGWVTIVSE